MDTTDTPLSANSKVIIQCTDPYDLFGRVEPRLSARSPLRNLHWKASNRPLRSIPNLNISLSREAKPDAAQSSVRRHQIPGLRETPYVKVYLVRCDDKETYKETVRKEVRQWVKTQTSSAESKSLGKNQEDHDASEWLILHVVLPNTPAASQPKSSKHISVEASESTDSVNSKSKWPGKSSSTIYDKLRADFSSSKSSSGRVAQVRLLEAGDKSTALTAVELEEQWQDLVDNLKSYILRSFDARVAQYESDIRERDSQRHLPGWNFCTFFVLKEGLAKGFENLGLLEDALTVYDELSVGLDALVKEQEQLNDSDEGGALLTFSKETKTLLRTALDLEAHAASPQSPELVLSLRDIVDADRNNYPFDAEKKNYQSLILSSEVSALDLRTYLFIREVEILARRAHAPAVKSATTGKINTNPAIVADLVERAVQFISLATRGLHFELYHAWGGREGLDETELRNQRTIIGNIVTTRQWRAIMQILAQALPLLGLDAEQHADVLSLDALELSTDRGADFRAPSPGSDNSLHRMSLAPNMRSLSRERSQERGQRHSMVLSNGTDNKLSMLAHPEFQRLALWTSKLVLMARHALASLEVCRAWTVDSNSVALEPVSHQVYGSSTDGEIDFEDEERQTQGDLIAGLDSTMLQTATTSKSHFVNLYTLLSVAAFRLVRKTGNHATMRQILTNLADVEYSRGNRVLAARYLRHLLGPLPRFSHQHAEGHLLRMYAACLEHLDRPNDYARCLISCLHHTKRASLANSAQIPIQSDQHYVNRLLEVLSIVPSLSLPLASLFKVSIVSKTIVPLERRDGFALSIGLKNVAGVDMLVVDAVKLRLINRDHGDLGFILLTLSEKVRVNAKDTIVSLEASVTTQGWFVPDELELSIGNLRLLHNLTGSHADDGGESGNMTNHPVVMPILVYPNHRSFAVKMYPYPITHLADIRRLLLQIRPGVNEVVVCRLRLRTATGGLRLNIHDAKLVGDHHGSTQLSTAREGEALLVVLNELCAESVIDVEIPYTIESASEPSVTLRVEAHYETDQGQFTYHNSLTAKIILPVTVNVQDIVRKKCMFSKFTVSPATMVPLRLIGCRLETDDCFDVVTSEGFEVPFVVFPKQPASWTVCLKPTSPTIKTPGRMTLVVDFQSLDGLIFAILERCFTEEIIQTDLAFAARLLASHLVERVRTSWTEQDVEVAGLLQEFEVWRMEDMQWAAVLCAFDKETRANVEDWLRAWHLRTPTIKFSSVKIPQRQLKLFVNVPPRPLLVSARLDVQLSTTVNANATIGQPIVTELVLTLLDRDEAPIEASFELVAISESWLIGGKRKGYVHLRHEPVRVCLLLFPQQLGHLLLPTVNVRCRRRVDSEGPQAWSDVASEIHNTSYGRSILISPNLRSTTVEVFGSMPDDGTGRLITGESRGGIG